MRGRVKKNLRGMLAMLLSIAMVVTYIPETTLTAFAAGGQSSVQETDASQPADVTEAESATEDKSGEAVEAESAVEESAADASDETTDAAAPAETVDEASDKDATEDAAADSAATDAGKAEEPAVEPAAEEPAAPKADKITPVGSLNMPTFRLAADGTQNLIAWNEYNGFPKNPFTMGSDNKLKLYLFDNNTNVANENYTLEAPNYQNPPPAVEVNVSWQGDWRDLGDVSAIYNKNASGDYVEIDFSDFATSTFPFPASEWYEIYVQFYLKDSDSTYQDFSFKFRHEEEGSQKVFGAGWNYDENWFNNDADVDAKQGKMQELADNVEYQRADYDGNLYFNWFGWEIDQENILTSYVYVRVPSNVSGVSAAIAADNQWISGNANAALGVDKLWDYTPIVGWDDKGPIYSDTVYSYYRVTLPLNTQAGSKVAGFSVTAGETKSYKLYEVLPQYATYETSAWSGWENAVGTIKLATNGQIKFRLTGSGVEIANTNPKGHISVNMDGHEGMMLGYENKWVEGTNGQKDHWEWQTLTNYSIFNDPITALNSNNTAKSALEDEDKINQKYGGDGNYQIFTYTDSSNTVEWNPALTVAKEGVNRIDFSMNNKYGRGYGIGNMTVDNRPVYDFVQEQGSDKGDAITNWRDLPYNDHPDTLLKPTADNTFKFYLYNGNDKVTAVANTSYVLGEDCRFNFNWRGENLEVCYDPNAATNYMQLKTDESTKEVYLEIDLGGALAEHKGYLSDDGSVVLDPQERYDLQLWFTVDRWVSGGTNEPAEKDCYWDYQYFLHHDEEERDVLMFGAGDWDDFSCVGSDGGWTEFLTANTGAWDTANNKLNEAYLVKAWQYKLSQNWVSKSSWGGVIASSLQSVNTNKTAPVYIRIKKALLDDPSDTTFFQITNRHWEDRDEEGNVTSQWDDLYSEWLASTVSYLGDASINIGGTDVDYSYYRVVLFNANKKCPLGDVLHAGSDVPFKITLKNGVEKEFRLRLMYIQYDIAPKGGDYSGEWKGIYDYSMIQLEAGDRIRFDIEGNATWGAELTGEIRDVYSDEGKMFTPTLLDTYDDGRMEYLVEQIGRHDENGDCDYGSEWTDQNNNNKKYSGNYYTFHYNDWSAMHYPEFTVNEGVETVERLQFNAYDRYGECLCGDGVMFSTLPKLTLRQGDADGNLVGSIMVDPGEDNETMNPAVIPADGIFRIYLCDEDGNKINPSAPDAKFNFKNGLDFRDSSVRIWWGDRECEPLAFSWEEEKDGNNTIGYYVQIDLSGKDSSEWNNNWVANDEDFWMGVKSFDIRMFLAFNETSNTHPDSEWRWEFCEYGLRGGSVAFRQQGNEGQKYYEAYKDEIDWENAKYDGIDWNDEESVNSVDLTDAQREALVMMRDCGRYDLRDGGDPNVILPQADGKVRIYLYETTYDPKWDMDCYTPMISETNPLGAKPSVRVVFDAYDGKFDREIKPLEASRVTYGQDSARDGQWYLEINLSGLKTTKDSVEAVLDPYKCSYQVDIDFSGKALYTLAYHPVTVLRWNDSSGNYTNELNVDMTADIDQWTLDRLTPFCKGYADPSRVYRNDGTVVFYLRVPKALKVTKDTLIGLTPTEKNLWVGKGNGKVENWFQDVVQVQLLDFDALNDGLWAGLGSWAVYPVDDDTYYDYYQVRLKGKGRNTMTMGAFTVNVGGMTFDFTLEEARAQYHLASEPDEKWTDVFSTGNAKEMENESAVTVSGGNTVNVKIKLAGGQADIDDDKLVLIRADRNNFYSDSFRLKLDNMTDGAMKYWREYYVKKKGWGLYQGDFYTATWNTNTGEPEAFSLWDESKLIPWGDVSGNEVLPVMGYIDDNEDFVDCTYEAELPENAEDLWDVFADGTRYQRYVYKDKQHNRPHYVWYVPGYADDDEEGREGSFYIFDYYDWDSQNNEFYKDDAHKHTYYPNIWSDPNFTSSKTYYLFVVGKDDCDRSGWYRNKACVVQFVKAKYTVHPEYDIEHKLSETTKPIDYSGDVIKYYIFKDGQKIKIEQGMEYGFDHEVEGGWCQIVAWSEDSSAKWVVAHDEKNHKLETDKDGYLYLELPSSVLKNAPVSEYKPGTTDPLDFTTPVPYDFTKNEYQLNIRLGIWYGQKSDYFDEDGESLGNGVLINDSQRYSPIENLGAKIILGKDEKKIEHYAFVKDGEKITLANTQGSVELGLRNVDVDQIDIVEGIKVTSSNPKVAAIEKAPVCSENRYSEGKLAYGKINLKGVGDATIKMTFKLKDGTKKEITFTMTVKYKTAKSLTDKDLKIELVEAEHKYTGKEIKPAMTVSEGDYGLVEGLDYDVKYEDNIKVGTGKVTVTGKGNYKDSVTREFKIYGNVIYKYAQGYEKSPAGTDLPAIASAKYYDTGLAELASVDVGKGYKLAWYREPNCWNRATKIPAGIEYDVTLYGKWEPIKYYVEFLSGDREATGEMERQTLTYDVEEPLAGNLYSLNKKTFNGWNTKKDGSGTPYANGAKVKNLATEEGAVVTLYAQWANANYKVIYKLASSTDPTGAPAEAPEADGFSSDSGLTQLREMDEFIGYTFSWYSDKNCKNTITEIKSGTKKNVTVYGKWTPIEYTIKFEGKTPGDTNATAVEGQTTAIKTRYDKEETLTKNAFSRGKYFNFIGWIDEYENEYSDEEVVMNLAGYDADDTEITLYAVWVGEDTFPINYANIEVGADDVEENDNPTLYTKNETIKLKDPVRAGYTLEGWYEDKRCTKKAVDDDGKLLTAGKEGITLYAKWKPKETTITFNSNQPAKAPKDVEKTMATQTVKYGKSTKLRTNAFKLKGYTFAGWNTEKDGSGIAYADKAATDLNIAESAKNGALTLYAQWKPVVYKITYTNAVDGKNGVINGLPVTCTVEDGTIDLEKLDGKAYAPERPGYTLFAWCVGKSWKASKVTTTIDATEAKNQTVYAKWDAHTVTVKYNVNRPANAEYETKGRKMADQTVKYATTKTLTGMTNTIKGFQFTGWNTKADGSGKAYADKADTDLAFVEEYTKTGVTLYAQWVEKEHKITYVDAVNGKNSVSGNDNPAGFRTGDSIILTKTLTRTGYHFGGWYSDNSKKKALKDDKVDTSRARDVKVYAKWNGYTTKITFDKNQPAKAPSNISGKKVGPLTMTYGKTKTLPKNSYKLSGYIFVEWNTKADGTGDSYKDKATADLSLIRAKGSEPDGGELTLYAIWKPVQYKITYANTFAKVPTVSGNTVSDNDVSGNGFIDEEIDEDEPEVENPAYYTVEDAFIVARAGDGNKDDATKGSEIILAPVSRPGYDFAGWYLDKNLKKPLSSVKNVYKTSKKKAVTFYAKWKPTTYTIHYDSNIGWMSDIGYKGTIPGVVPDQKATYTKTVKLMMNRFKCDGYKFVGWSTKKNADPAKDDKIYTSKMAPKNLTTKKAVTLYAIWEKK